MKRIGFAFGVCILGLYCYVGVAATTDWNVNNGDWSVSSNWTNGVPTNADDAYIRNNGTALITQDGAECYRLYLGSGSETGNVEMTGGSLSFNRMLYVGYGNVGRFTQSAGEVHGGIIFYVAYSGSSDGSEYVLSGTGTLSAAREYIGFYGKATFTQNGGSNTTSNMTLAANGVYGGSRGIYQLNDGTLTVNDELHLCDSSNYETNTTEGILNQAGGTLSVNKMYIGYGSKGTITAQYNVSGGNASITELYVGYGKEGTFKVSGADASISVDTYTQNNLGSLVSELTGDGISVISVSGQASLDGTWEVIDSGAGFGRFDILTADSGITGNFANVVLPNSTDWNWGITGNTLWVEHVPEPTTLLLILMSVVCFIIKRQ